MRLSPGLGAGTAMGPPGSTTDLLGVAAAAGAVGAAWTGATGGAGDAAGVGAAARGADAAAGEALTAAAFGGGAAVTAGDEAVASEAGAAVAAAGSVANAAAGSAAVAAGWVAAASGVGVAALAGACSVGPDGDEQPAASQAMQHNVTVNSQRLVMGGSSARMCATAEALAASPIRLLYPRLRLRVSGLAASLAPDTACCGYARREREPPGGRS